MCEIKLSKTFHEHPKAGEIMEKVKIALEYFPEIDEITLSRCGTRGTFAIAWANKKNKEVSFNIEYFPSFNTIFHELGHILQGLTPIPSGEEACTIFALSRIPDHLIESYDLPYLGLVPVENIRDYCKLAIQQRESGNRTYIKWLRERIQSDREKDINYNWPKCDIYEEKIKKKEILKLPSLKTGQSSLADFTA